MTTLLQKTLLSKFCNIGDHFCILGDHFVRNQLYRTKEVCKTNYEIYDKILTRSTSKQTAYAKHRTRKKSGQFWETILEELAEMKLRNK